MRVMVDEDDDDLRLAVTTDLAGAGLDVDQSADIATADVALSEGDHDCVVFDRMLPDGDAVHYVHRRSVMLTSPEGPIRRHRTVTGSAVVPGRSDGRCHRVLMRPPSMRKSLPVMLSAWLLARYRTRLAISCG